MAPLRRTFGEDIGVSKRYRRARLQSDPLTRGDLAALVSTRSHRAKCPEVRRALEAYLERVAESKAATAGSDDDDDPGHRPCDDMGVPSDTACRSDETDATTRQA